MDSWKRNMTSAFMLRMFGHRKVDVERKNNKSGEWKRLKLFSEALASFYSSAALISQDLRIAPYIVDFYTGA